MSSGNARTHNLALAGLMAEIERGIRMVAAMADDDYAYSRSGESAIGAHIRHNLDFINAALKGIAIGRVDYNDRSRDGLIETDREYAMQEMSSAYDRLRSLNRNIIGSLILVRSEVDGSLWHTSTVSREIEFLHSHTVHHYALIKMLMASDVESVSSSFGVSPSTLRYRSGASVVSY